MKVIYFSILFLIIASCSTTQKIPLEDSYEKIIEVPNLSKDQLYIRANAWFVEAFKSAESVIQFQDKEAGSIMGKYVFKSSYTSNKYHYRNIISIDVRDNKARIKFYEPRVYSVPLLESKGSYKLISSLGLATRNYHLSRNIIGEWNWMAKTLEKKLNEADDF
jgi:Domain of unknown function (DUF4468) with TBP-like fold